MRDEIERHRVGPAAASIASPDEPLPEREHDQRVARGEEIVGHHAEPVLERARRAAGSAAASRCRRTGRRRTRRRPARRRRRRSTARAGTPRPRPRRSRRDRARRGCGPVTCAAQTPIEREHDDRGDEAASGKCARSDGGDRYRDQRAEGAGRDRREAGAEPERDEMRRMAEQERERRRGECAHRRTRQICVAAYDDGARREDRGHGGHHPVAPVFARLLVRDRLQRRAARQQEFPDVEQRAGERAGADERERCGR